MTFRERILAFATDARGTQEDPIGSNRGKFVDQVNEEAGAPLGSSWCMSFAFHCVSHAALHAGIACPILRTASCAALYDWARTNGRLTQTPEPGDIGLVKGGPHGHKHAVIVVSGDGPGLFRELAGNTNTAGGSEGYEVAAHVRRMAACDFVSVEPA